LNNVDRLSASSIVQPVMRTPLQRWTLTLIWVPGGVMLQTIGKRIHPEVSPGYRSLEAAQLAMEVLSARPVHRQSAPPA
jgi:hypothetical protein